MTLKDKITGDMTAAMKAKDADRLSVLRMAKAALMNEANKKGAGYENAGRAELAEKEKSELAILQAYLPQAAGKEEIERAVNEAVAETGATSMREMGAVMKAAQTKLAGKSADGKLLSETVKEKLQNQ